MFSKSKKTSGNSCFQIQIFIAIAILSSFAVDSWALPIFEEPVFFQESTSLSTQARKQLEKIALRKTVASVHAVQLDLPLLHIAEPSHGQPVGFNVEHDIALPVMMNSQTKRGSGSYIWRGSIVDDQGGQVTLVVNKRKVSGMIRWGTQIYAVEPLLDGNHALIHIDPSKFPPDHPAKVELGDIKSSKASTQSAINPLMPDLWAGERNLFQNKATLDNRVLDPAINERLNNIQARPTTASIHSVNMVLPLLSDTDQSLNLNLAPDINLPVAFASQDQNGNSGFIWRGTVLNDTGGQVTLVADGNNVTGMIRTGTEIYAVEPLGNGDHVLIRIDSSKFPPDHPVELGDGGIDFPANFNQPSNLISTNTTQRKAPLTQTIINVLVAYTPSAKAAYTNMNGLITLAVDEANQSYQNSLIPITLNLVSKYQNQYNESGSFYTDLELFRINGDGVMDAVHSLRDTYSADVAVLIINNSSACGLASSLMADSSTAFAIVHYDCAVGYYSFAHEIGHLQGAHHDIAADSSTGPVCSSFDHGYVNTTKGWRTIMAYNNSDCLGGNCTRVQYWSNPSVNYMGDPTGVALQSNNARCLKQTRDTVAGFK